MNLRFTLPDRSDQEEFLVRLYFGSGTNYLRNCVRRAYLDFNRTLQGIRNLPNRNKFFQQASSEVEKALIRLKNGVRSQDDFDKWHRHACAGLISTYHQYGYKEFRTGQAQKWLNMSLKYIFTLGEKRLPGYANLYKFGHIPLDNIILKQLNPYSPPKLSCSWSRIREYDEYLNFQQWIRKAFSGSIPLAVEFRLWLNGKELLDGQSNQTKSSHPDEASGGEERVSCQQAKI